MTAEEYVGRDALTLARAPVHKRAFGMAVGLIAGGIVFLLTVFHIVLHANGEGGLNIALLAQFFYGYSVSWVGAFIGLAWGFATGVVFAWFLAFVRNLVVTVLAFAVMTEEDAAQTRRFLDHI